MQERPGPYWAVRVGLDPEFAFSPCQKHALAAPLVHRWGNKMAHLDLNLGLRPSLQSGLQRPLTLS